MEESKIQEQLLRFDSFMEGANYLRWIEQPLFGQGDVIVIEGRMGSSAAMTGLYLAYQEHLRGRIVYSNYNTSFSRITRPDFLDSIYNSIVLWDDFPSFYGNKSSGLFSYFLMQGRKRNNLVIVPNPIDRRVKYACTLLGKVQELKEDLIVRFWDYRLGLRFNFIINKKNIPKEVLDGA